jgi:hypothetical protein
MIRIIAELRDGGIVHDVAPGPLPGSWLTERYFAWIEQHYKSRPLQIRLEYEEFGG